MSFAKSSQDTETHTYNSRDMDRHSAFMLAMKSLKVPGQIQGWGCEVKRCWKRSVGRVTTKC